MIPLFKPYMPQNIVTGVEEILYSGQLAYGKWGRKLEEELIKYLGNANVLATNSHSAALHVAFSTLGVVAGDEVIMSPMCCLQSTQPLVARGAKIVWADIDPATGTLDPDSVKSKITQKTKAIFHNQHMGFVGYIEEINAIAKNAGIYTIDDCVDGMGGIYKGKKVGNVGSDATVISFHAVRLPNAIEGGAVSFNNSGHFQNAKIIRDQGIDRSQFRDTRGEISEDYDVITAGYPALPNDLSSYLAFKQMKDLDKLFEIQHNNVKKWKQFIETENIPARQIDIVPESQPNNWVFGMLTDKKNEMIDYFRAIGYYASGVHLNNNRYSLFGDKTKLKGVDEFYSRFVALPSGWWCTL